MEIQKCKRSDCQPEVAVMPCCDQNEYQVQCHCGKVVNCHSSSKEAAIQTWNEVMANG